MLEFSSCQKLCRLTSSEQPQASSQVFREVPLRDGSTGDIIKFYNLEFIPLMEPSLKLATTPAPRKPGKICRSIRCNSQIHLHGKNCPSFSEVRPRLPFLPAHSPFCLQRPLIAQVTQRLSFISSRSSAKELSRRPSSRAAQAEGEAHHENLHSLVLV